MKEVRKMIIQQLNMKNYRGQQQIVLNDLGAVNVLVGQNNSGKTSVLEALHLLSNPSSSILFRQIAFQRERHHNYKTQADLPEAIRWMFSKNEATTHAPIELAIQTAEGETTYSWQLTEKEYHVIGRNDFHFEDDYLEFEERIEIEQTITVKKEGQLLKEYTFTDEVKEETLEDQTDYYHCKHVSAVDYKVLALSIRTLSKVIRENKVSLILEALQWFNPEIVDIKIIPNEFNRNTIYLEHQTMGITPIMTFGDGLRKVLYLALAVFEAENGVLLIDEIEIGIHTSLLTQVMKWLVSICDEQNIQLFITTHSLETVDAIIEAFEQEASPVVLYRLENQQVKRLGGEDLKNIRTTFGMDVR